VSPVRYELDFYIPEEGILHSHRREDLKILQKYYFGSEVEICRQYVCAPWTHIYNCSPFESLLTKTMIRFL
jgi:hypothetical protein